MTTGHKYGCEHPGCHEVGVQRGIGPGVLTWAFRWLCAAHADKEATTDG